jgi:hypothetical protein
MGAATATMPTIQASAVSTSLAAGVPSVRSRTALTTTESGWCSANPWSHDGIVEPDRGEDPRDGVAEEQHEQHAGEHRTGTGVGPPPDRETDDRHERDHERVAHQISERATGEDCRT